MSEAESAINKDPSGESSAEFRRARTVEQVEARKAEIICACKKLYEEGGYDAVNFKAVSDTTSITRQAIYSYYKTKEEVLLDILVREEKLWETDMLEAMENYPSMSPYEYALFLTGVFSGHGIMLELTSMLFNVLESGCRMEKLVEFRSGSADIYHLLFVSVAKYFPTFSRQSHRVFVSTVFALAVGLHPMNHMSHKQLEAERIANASFVYPDNFDRSTSFETQFHASVMLLLAGMK